MRRCEEDGGGGGGVGREAEIMRIHMYKFKKTRLN